MTGGDRPIKCGNISPGSGGVTFESGTLQKLFPNEFKNPGKVKTITSCDLDANCRKVLGSLNPVALSVPTAVSVIVIYILFTCFLICTVCTALNQNLNLKSSNCGNVEAKTAATTAKPGHRVRHTGHNMLLEAWTRSYGWMFLPSLGPSKHRLCNNSRMPSVQCPAFFETLILILRMLQNNNWPGRIVTVKGVLLVKTKARGRS